MATYKYWDDSFKLSRKPGNVGMQYFEDNFLSLRSGFFNTTSPTNPSLFMRWADSDNFIQRFRSHDGQHWYGMFHGDLNQKIWKYRDDTIDGWVIDNDSSYADCVIAIKGGSEAYNVDGGEIAGVWDDSIMEDHVHSVFSNIIFNWPTSTIGKFASHDSLGNWHIPSFKIPSAYPTFAIVGYNTTVLPFSGSIRYTGSTLEQIDLKDYTFNYPGYVLYTDEGLNSVTVEDWRPEAAVGTIQYLDLT